ncbi:MAG: flagellar hook-length control protein FliK [Desulfovibrio sp.]|nr:flagellar hook-length control protein FliK [Desulfovibrio sp.]
MQFLPTDITSFFATRDSAPTGGKAAPQPLNAPGSNARRATGALAGEPESAAEEFQRFFHEALTAVDGGEEVSATAALRDTAGPLARGPYSRHTTDGVTYSLEEVCFTKKELLELRRDLLKAGAPEQALKYFDALADHPDGATLAQVMVSLRQMAVPRQLDKTDRNNIAELLGKIDPTGDLAREALDLMEEGRGQAALELISQTFSAVESDGVEMRKDQLLSLGRGLGLDAATLRRLAGGMGDYEAGLFSGAQFNALTAPAQEQFAAENARQSKVNNALESTLKPVIARARARTEKEKSASSLQERKVEQSKTHIEKTVLQNSRRRLDSVLREGQSGHADAAPQAGPAHSDAVGRKGGTNRSDAVSGDDAEKTSPREKGNKSAAAAPVTERTGMPLPETGGKSVRSGLPEQDIVSARLSRGAPRQDSPPPTQAWLADRLTAQNADKSIPPGQRPETGPPLRNDAARASAAQPTAAKDEQPEDGMDRRANVTHFAAARPVNTTNFVESGGGGQPAGDNLSGSSGRRGNSETPARAPHIAAPHHPAFGVAWTPGDIPAAAPRQAARQVEESLYAALRGEAPATTRLDLQLHPRELGSISIALTLRNGEVRALIRSETEETADLLSRQDEAIRANLEQQGVKVDKIEVRHQDQTGNDGGDDRRQNQDQHNARREKDSLRGELDRPHADVIRFAAARPVNATRFVEAGKGGQAAGDNSSGSSGRRGSSETPAAAPHIAAPHHPAFGVAWTPGDIPAAAPRQAARQVEQSLYAALRGEAPATTRLDLQLHPRELGSISIALTLHNGEVRALIRSEKEETADLLSRQAEGIRASLEQQGVKVDKIEVRHQDQANSDGGGDGRQNLDQHNARREKDSLRDELDRLHTLANIRNSLMNSGNEILEQPVHYAGQTARHADRTLHLVA